MLLLLHDTAESNLYLQQEVQCCALTSGATPPDSKHLIPAVHVGSP